MDRSGPAPKTVMPLLAAVVILGSSTACMATGALQQKASCDTPWIEADHNQSLTVSGPDLATSTATRLNAITVTGR